MTVACRAASFGIPDGWTVRLRPALSPVAAAVTVHRRSSGIESFGVVGGRIRSMVAEIWMEIARTDR
jgi:hypothetical protein